MKPYSTGFCWKCGKVIALGLLFCPGPKKCEEQYNRKQEAEIKKSKRQGYGLAGSTH